MNMQYQLKSQELCQTSLTETPGIASASPTPEAKGVEAHAEGLVEVKLTPPRGVDVVTAEPTPVGRDLEMVDGLRLVPLQLPVGHRTEEQTVASDLSAIRQGKLRHRDGKAEEGSRSRGLSGTKGPAGRARQEDAAAAGGVNAIFLAAAENSHQKAEKGKESGARPSGGTSLGVAQGSGETIEATPTAEAWTMHRTFQGMREPAGTRRVLIQKDRSAEFIDSNGRGHHGHGASGEGLGMRGDGLALQPDAGGAQGDLVVHGTKFAGDTGAAGADAGSLGRLQPTQNRLLPTIGPRSPSTEALRQQAGGGSARQPGAHPATSLKRTLSPNRQRRLLLQQTNAGGALQHPGGIKARGAGFRANKKDIGRSLEHHLDGFTVQALPGLPARAPSGCSGANAAASVDQNSDLAGVLDEEAAAKEEELMRRQVAGGKDGPFAFAGARRHSPTDSATRRYGKRSRHRQSPRQELKAAGPATKLAHRPQADVIGPEIDLFQLSTSELADFAAQYKGDLRGLPLRHLPHYKLKIFGKAVERKDQQSKEARKDVKKAPKVSPARSGGVFGKRVTRWGMTSEGSQANLDQATPAARPSANAESHNYDPSAEGTGQEATSGGSRQDGRQTPSRDLLHTLGLNLTKTSGQINQSELHQGLDPRTHGPGTLAGTYNIGEGYDHEKGGSSPAGGSSTHAQERVSRLQDKSRSYLRAHRDGGTPGLGGEAAYKLKDNPNTAKDSPNVVVTQKIPIIGEIEGQLVQVGQVVGPHVPPADSSQQQLSREMTATLSGAGPPEEVVQGSTLHDEGFDEAARGTNPIDGPPTTTEPSQERSNSNHTRSGPMMQRSQDAGLIAVQGGTGAALVSPVSPDNQATILQLLRKQGAVERVALQSIPTHQQTGTSSMAKKNLYLQGSAEKVALRRSRHDAQQLSNSSLYGMMDRPSKYAHDAADADGPSHESRGAVGARPQPVLRSSRNIPAICASPLNTISLDDLRDPTAEPGSSTLSPENSATKGAARPLFGPRKGSTLLLKNPSDQTDAVPFRVADPPAESYLVATLQQARRQLQAAEYRKLKEQIEEQTARHRDARILGNVGAIIQLKRQLCVQGHVQAINSGYTADSLRYELKDRRKRSGIRGNRGARPGGAADLGTSGLQPAGAANSPASAGEMDLRRALVDAAAASADAGDARLDVPAQDRLGELVEQRGTRTELEQFGSTVGEPMIQLVDEGQPTGGTAQPLGMTPSPGDISSHARASPLRPTGIEQGAKVTVNIQQVPQHYDTGLMTVAPAAAARHSVHSRDRLLEQSEHDLQLSNQPSMETIGLAANKRKPTPLNAIDAGQAKQPGASSIAEDDRIAPQAKIQGHGLESPPHPETAMTGSAQATKSSGLTVQSRMPAGNEGIGAILSASGRLNQNKSDQRGSTAKVGEAQAGRAERLAGESLKILDEAINEEAQPGATQPPRLDPAAYDVAQMQDHLRNVVGTSYIALSPLSPSFPSPSSASIGSVFKRNRLSFQPGRMLREIRPEGDLLSPSRSPTSSLVRSGLRDFPRAQALSHLYSGSGANHIRGAAQRQVFVERTRYGRVQNHRGKVVSTMGPHDATLGPDEVKALERSYPFATILDGAQVEKSRRLQALYRQFDAEMTMQRRQLQYATDVLPYGAKLKPAQPKAPQNRYFKKVRFKSVAAVRPEGDLRGPFVVPAAFPLHEAEAQGSPGLQAVDVVPSVMPIPSGLAYQTGPAQSGHGSSTPRAADLEFINDLMLADEAPLAENRSSVGAQSESVTALKKAESRGDPPQKPSKASLAASNRHQQMLPQYGPVDSKRALGSPTAALASDRPSPEHQPGNLRATSDKNQNALANQIRRRHELEINEIGERPLQASFRETQRFESRNKLYNKSSQGGSQLNVQSQKLNYDAKGDRSMVETPKRGGPSGQQQEVQEMNEQNSTERSEVELAAQGRLPRHGSYQMVDPQHLMQVIRPQQIRIEAQEGLSQQMPDQQATMSGAYQFITQQSHASGENAHLQNIQAPAITQDSGFRILQSTESILDSSFINSKKLKSVLKTAGRRKDSFTGALFDAKHFERYKVLQEGANHILSEEGPLARDMQARAREQSQNGSFVRVALAEEDQERHDFLARVEQFKRELQGIGAQRMHHQLPSFRH